MSAASAPPTSTSTSKSGGSISSKRSRLNQIWQSYMDQWQQIDDLETKLDEAVMRKRRRISNLLDELPTFRKSNVRFFVTHKTIRPCQQYEILVEGRLLVGHLDHMRARQIDDEKFGGQVNPEVDPNDRSHYRGGMAEREGDVPVEPIHFTHFLDSFQATVYAVWQPVSMLPKTSQKRQKGKTKKINEDLLKTSAKLFLSWTRERKHLDVASSPDSHGFIIPYTCPPVPAPDLVFHSIVVEINTKLRHGEEALYKPSPALSKTLFPQHSNEQPEIGGKKKKKSSENSIPMVNTIFVPSLLSMQDVVTAFFLYIKFHKLRDETEPSVIVCDKAMADLLEVERFNFADLQHLLIAKQLLQPGDEPAKFTYCIVDESDVNSMLQVDFDVYVPSLFHYRCRELLRRIKQREFEYTSSRTRARNWLVTSKVPDERVRILLEDCVKGEGFEVKHVGAWLALARAAPDGSEARTAAQLDAKMCYLLEQVKQTAKRAQNAWDIVDACQANTNSGQGEL